MNLKPSPLAALLALTLGAGLPVSPAVAAEDPPVAEESLEEPGLQEKGKRVEKVEPVDPDTTLNNKVETRRREIQDLLNKFQEAVGNKKDGLTKADAKAWDKITVTADKLVQGFLADNEKYLEAHRALLESFQAASNAGKGVEANLVGKQLIKLRTDLLAKLDKLSTQSAKVKVEWEKLEASIQKNAE